MPIRICTFAIWGVMLAPSASLAQELDFEISNDHLIDVGEASLELGLPPTREQELEAGLHEAERQMYAAGIGLTLSVAAIVAGSALLGRGLSRDFCVSFGDGECPNDAGTTAMQVAGPLVFVAGVIGTGFTGRAVRRARRTKARFEDELRRTTVQIGPTSLSVRYRF